MLVIHEQTFELRDVIELHLPTGCEILDLQDQRGQMCIWYISNVDAPVQRVLIKCVGTGNMVPNNYLDGTAFMSTVQQGPFVWHFFRVL